MHVNGEIQRMLQSLRDAIHEAIADSPGIAAAMSELEREGVSPSFSVEVSLPEERIADSGEEVACAGELLLNSADENFLRTIGIAVAG
jgi:hypothetical protein